jgi:hypothetical protein
MRDCKAATNWSGGRSSEIVFGKERWRELGKVDGIPLEVGVRMPRVPPHTSRLDRGGGPRGGPLPQQRGYRRVYGRI